jgi:hypothetical protein
MVRQRQSLSREDQEEEGIGRSAHLDGWMICSSDEERGPSLRKAEAIRGEVG